MFQLPERMRRELATLVKDPQIKALLMLPEQELQQALDAMAQKLRTRGLEWPVIAAYQALAPLLWENVAVLAYRAQTGASGTAAALPDLGTVDEALNVALVDYRLNPQQQRQLRKLLSDRPDL